MLNNNFVLSTQNNKKGCIVAYVKDYIAETEKLVITGNIREAKQYKNKAGAKSSARSILEKIGVDFKPQEIFEGVE